MSPATNASAEAAQESTSPVAQPAASAGEAGRPAIDAFNWLLVLGFPAEVAAVVLRPDRFGG